MDAFQLIVTLSVVGFLLLTTEVFVPGFVLGTFACFSLLGAVILAYVTYGGLIGSLVFAGLGLAVFTGFLIWMAAFPHTAIGRRLMLQKNNASGSSIDLAGILQGSEGKALTTLRPSGTALFQGRKVDVVSEGELIEKGDAITVVRDEGYRVLVRKSVGTSASSL